MSVHPKDWAEAHVNGAAIREVADRILEVADRVRDDRGDASDVSEPDMSILKRNRLAASPYSLLKFWVPLVRGSRRQQPAKAPR